LGDIRDDVPPVQILGIGGTCPPCPIGIDAPARPAFSSLRPKPDLFKAKATVFLSSSCP